MTAELRLARQGAVRDVPLVVATRHSPLVSLHRPQAAKKLVDSGRLPNIHCLFVGEGPDKQMLLDLIAELKVRYMPLHVVTEDVFRSHRGAQGSARPGECCAKAA